MSQLTKDEVLQGFIDGIMTYDANDYWLFTCDTSTCDTCRFGHAEDCKLAIDIGVIKNRYIPSLKITHPEFFV